ncbi:hypothetical protein CJT94_24520 [Pseudomonas aeruginosa]|nr:hypothetical protein CJT94_24520 [Pseudomonas aeruginosa]
MKAQRGKPKAKHIESELLSAVVRTAPPAGCRSPAGERGRNTDFTGWPSTEGQTGSQYALEGKAMTVQLHNAQYANLIAERDAYKLAMRMLDSCNWLDSDPADSEELKEAKKAARAALHEFND